MLESQLAMDPNPFAATLLRTSAQGLAGLATGKLYEDSAALVPAPEEFGDWKAHLQRQVVELAAAVEAGSPEEFATQLVWSRDAFRARDVPLETLSASVTALREVVAESLPGELAQGLAPYFEAAVQKLEQPGPTRESLLESEPPLERLARDYLALVLDARGAEARALLVEELRAGRLEVAEALENVLAPAMREIGSLWHLGRVDAADEHYASTTTQLALAQVLAQAERSPANGLSVLVSSVAGNAHGLGVQIVSSLFELDGWRAICLGADMPAQDLAQAAARFDVSLVALGATLSTHRGAVAQSIEILRAERPGLKILVGGPAFDADESTWRQVGADAFGATAQDAVRVGRRLLGLDS